MNLFSVSEQGRIATVQELKDRFYEWHSEWIHGRRCACSPQSLVLNPIGSETDCYYAIYYPEFVKIEINPTSPSGPHAAKLFIQVYPATLTRNSRFEWLGTTQFDCYFYDERAIRRNLFTAIRKRNYFCSNRVANSKVDFTTPEQAEDINPL